MTHDVIYNCEKIIRKKLVEKENKWIYIKIVRINYLRNMNLKYKLFYGMIQNSNINKYFILLRCSQNEANLYFFSFNEFYPVYNDWY